MVFPTRPFHCSWLLVALATLTGQAGAGAQQPAQESPPLGYTIFVRGTPIGREDITVSARPDGTTITSTGRVATPVDLTIRRAEFRYRQDRSPESFSVDGSIGGTNLSLKTTFEGGSAATDGTQAGSAVSATHAVSAQAIIHSNLVAASYVALAGRLQGSTAGAELPLYVVPQAEITVRVEGVRDEQMQIGASFLDVRRYQLTFENPGAQISATLTTAADGGLVSVSIPAQLVDIVRQDIAASTSRTLIHSNPGDEPVTIPASGFNLGATITRPSSTPPGGKLPAVILLAGSGVNDRDGFVEGIATLGQLAGAIADGGFMAVRYDKRGYGQSGGRAESATIDDHAEDVRTVVRWLRDRDDVDRDRIAVVGHSEGAWVALLAASRERRIRGVVSIAAPSTTGAELVLEQQQRALEAANLTEDERAARVALQKQIHAAVLTDKGWDEIPPELRQQADTPWFRSLLAYEPEEVVRRVRQPLLILHGALDRQVPVEHAERLATLARERGRSEAIELVTVRGVNHLLVPAVTGEVSEYATLADRTVSADVTKAAVDWLKTTFASRR